MREITLNRPMLVDEIARLYLGHERNYELIYEHNPQLLHGPLWVPSQTIIKLPQKAKDAPLKRVRLFN